MSFFTRVKLSIKSKYDAIDNENFKRNFLNALPFWVGAFITGLIAVLYAKLFLLAEEGSHLLFNYSKWAFFAITPFTFFLGWWVVNKYAPFSRGSGIPQVTAAIELANPKNNYKVSKLLSIRIIFIKIISSTVVVFGGGAIGREGPIIQIAASIFHKINSILPNWYPKISKRNMIVTGAAAGLASAFNTPLGGIVFAIEELTKTHFSYFRSALITGVIIAGLTALKFFGPYLYIGSPELNNFHYWIFFIVLLIAIITGFLGCYMGRIILMILKKKEKIKTQFKKVAFVLICGLIMASFAILLNSKIFGSGKEIMISTLFSSNKQVEWYLPILRIIGPIVTFITGVSGGIFAPSLSAGASLGALLANTLHLSDSETNLIILCGMVGFLTGITKSPFTSSILVTEMTNSHSIIFYLMVAALLSNIISTLISKHSFYDYLKDNYIKEVHHLEEDHTTKSKT